MRNLIKVQVLVRYTESSNYITCGMGVDEEISYLPLDTNIKDYLDSGFHTCDNEELDLNAFTLFRGEYIPNEYLEQAEYEAGYEDQITALYDAQFDAECHANYVKYENEIERV